MRLTCQVRYTLWKWKRYSERYLCPGVMRARSNAGPASVTVTLPGRAITRNFSVIEPSGIDHAGIYNWLAYPTNQSGARMRLDVYVGPTNISFYRVQFLEVGQGASNVFGYFADTNRFPDLSHHPGDWNSLLEDNRWYGGDLCEMYQTPDGLPQPWSNGGLTWVIPGRWKVSDIGITNSFQNAWTQTFSIDTAGTVKIEKFGHWIQRTTNKAVTFSPGDPSNPFP